MYYSLIIIIPVTIGFVGLIYLFNSAKKLHAEIDIVEKKAIEASSKEELINAWDELLKVYQKTWHISFYIRINKIKTIIQIKYSLLDNTK